MIAPTPPSAMEEARTLCGCYACEVEWTADDPPECRKQRIARALSERDERLACKAYQATLDHQAIEDLQAQLRERERE